MFNIMNKLKIATILASLIIVGFTSNAVMAVNMNTMGVPELITRSTDGLVIAIDILVKKGWVNSDAHELDIEITSVNGDLEPQNHGHVVVQLSEYEVFGVERDTAIVRVEWDDEGYTREHQTYTATVFVLVNGEELTYTTVSPVLY